MSTVSDDIDAPENDMVNNNVFHVSPNISSSSDSEFSRDFNVRNDINIDPDKILKEIRGKNAERLIKGHININNSLHNKFEPLKALLQHNVDIFVISETKIDVSFPSNQFKIEGYYSPFRFNRNSLGGGVLIYVRDDIPCKELKNHKLPKDIEGIFIELTL